jgi:Uma2 family endonuclease
VGRSHHATARPRGISRAEYEKIAELGIFDGERVELIHGTIVEMSPIGPEHSDSVDRANFRLINALGSRARVRIQGAFAASDDSEPHPDVAVVPPGNYGSENPREAWVIIEVAKSSLADDREKACLYATSNVEESWIVNLVDDVVEVHRDPQGGRYRTIEAHPRSAAIQLQHFREVEIALAELFPRS